MNIDPQKVIAAGTKVGQLNNDFKKYMNNIKKQNDTLKSKWSGTDAQSCFKKVEEQYKELDSVQKAFAQIAQRLQQIGKAFNDARTANTMK